MGKIMISGTSSSVGKTTVTTAILSLLSDARPFKCGPDFIDPMFHEYVTGKPSVNIDLYMLGEATCRHLFNRHSSEEDISVLEGMMGLYDGLGHELDNYSAAHISRILDIPVILVIDGRKISTSAAATVKGFIEMDSRVRIKGVIVNRVGKGLYGHLKEAIELHTDAKCVGFIENDEDITIGERHLGLMQTSEIDDLENRINRLKQSASRTLDLEAISEIAGEMIADKTSGINFNGWFSGLKVGVPKDRAFSFYYNDNLEMMKDSGMEIKEYSPLEDSTLPDVDCLYLGGGYPEVFTETLSQNQQMMESVREFHESGKLIYAECGGMMYLCGAIAAKEGSRHPMAGIFPHEVRMRDRLNVKRFGYVECHTLDGILVKAHEFHYSEIENLNGDEKYYFKIKKAGRDREWDCGFMKKNTIAGYPHIHFYSNPMFFKSLFKRAYTGKGEKSE